MSILDSAINFVKGLGEGTTVKTTYRQARPQLIVLPPSNITPPAESQPPSNSSLDPAVISQNIAKTWGGATPILKNIDLMLKAGRQLPQTEDPLLPIALALRETQGGADLLNPQKNANLGQNNPYNVRGQQDGVTQFVNYPDLQTATFGGQNGPDQSQGVVGLLAKNPIYSDFQKTGNYNDLFSHWSPTSNGNGSMPDQVKNIRWIINQIRQGHQ